MYLQYSETQGWKRLPWFIYAPVQKNTFDNRQKITNWTEKAPL